MFIAPQNHRSLVWLRWGALLFCIAIFFILGGASFVVRGFVFVKNKLPFSQSTNEVSERILALEAKIADLEKEREQYKTTSSDANQTNNTISANISLGGGYLFADSIIVDRGTESGIAIGDYAFTKDGFFVGSIEESKAYWSRIVPFSQLGRKTIVRGGENKEIVFEINGAGGGEAVVDLPVSIILKVGDIFWSGEHPNLVLGIVDYIDRSSTKQIQTIHIKSLVSFKFLTTVTIYKKTI